MPDLADIAVIGAGAAGLAAGIFAAQEIAGRGSVALLDGARHIGAKILVSGGSRCNVTHASVTPADFNAPKTFVRHVLAAFGQREAVRWFESMGVTLKQEETGKLFPVTDSARTVLGALTERCKALGVEILQDHRVHAIECIMGESSQAPSIASESSLASVSSRSDPFTASPAQLPAHSHFRITHSHGELIAHRVILAAGGKSLPKTGSDGAGFTLAQSLGHTVMPTCPALVPLLLDPAFFHAAVSGLSCEVELSTFASVPLATGSVPRLEERAAVRGTDNPARPKLSLIDRRTGSLLFTHFGISGPVAMDASRHWVMANAQGRSPVLRCSFFPGRDHTAVDRLFIDLAQRQPRRTIASVMSEPLPQRLVEALLTQAGGLQARLPEHQSSPPINPALPIGQLPREARRQLVHLLTELVLPVTGDRGWNYAEVTAGGVPLSEVHYRDMQSRLVPGLYLAGEILDCDGRIGGFNFQWAWSTGHIAGTAAAKALQSP